jgi:hypothetical protein
MTTKHEMNDVIVVLPGIMGSTLHKDGKPVWETSSGAIVNGLRTLFRSVTSLRLPDDIGDHHPGDGVTAQGLVPDIRMPLGLWTFDLGYSKLVDFLKETFDVNTDAASGPRNLLTFPYDWRLSNRYNGELLRDVVEPALEQWRAQGGKNTNAKLVFICHSMGGLVARWYIDQLGGAANTSRLFTLGTPHRGALNALEQLVNGIRKGAGPFKLNLTSMARSFPSIHQLLPEYACIESPAAPSGMAKTTEISLPEMKTSAVADAMRFHNDIDQARITTAPSYHLHAIVGFKQPTMTSAQIKSNEVICLRTIAGTDESGDATVPRIAATPPDVAFDTAVPFAENHGGLVHNQAVFDYIEGVLTASHTGYREIGTNISIEIDEVLEAHEPLVVRAALVEHDFPLELLVTTNKGKSVGKPTKLSRSGDTLEAQHALPHPGVYLATVRGVGGAATRVRPITTTVLQWPTEDELDLPGS